MILEDLYNGLTVNSFVVVSCICSLQLFQSHLTGHELYYIPSFFETNDPEWIASRAFFCHGLKHINIADISVMEIPLNIITGYILGPVFSLLVDNTRVDTPFFLEWDPLYHKKFTANNNRLSCSKYGIINFRIIPTVLPSSYHLLSPSLYGLSLPSTICAIKKWWLGNMWCHVAHFWMGENFHWHILILEPIF